MKNMLQSILIILLTIHCYTACSFFKQGEQFEIDKETGISLVVVGHKVFPEGHVHTDFRILLSFDKLEAMNERSTYSDTSKQSLNFYVPHGQSIYQNSNELEIGTVLMQFIYTSSPDYVGARKAGNIDSQAYFGRHIRVRHIEIHKHFRKLGIGQKVMASLLKFYQDRAMDERSVDVARYKVEIQKDNIASLSIFEKHLGFNRVGHSSSCSDVVLLQKPFRDDEYRCQYCDNICNNSRCGKCRKVYYCNRVHQRLDWPVHKKCDCDK